MKAVGKRRTTSETSNDAAGAVDFGVVDGGGSGSGGYVADGASFAEVDHTQLQKGEAEQPHVEDSEEEADYDDEDDEEEEEQEEEHADQVAVSGPGKKGPILREGFYEVEAIRRKRIRRGQPQYLIKWRDWSEGSNTWEPLENLVSVPEVVAAFEASLRSAKRKRKRKHAVHHIQPKKRLERSATPYSLRQFPANTPDNHHTQSAPVNGVSIPDIPAFPQTVLFADEGENNGDASSLGNSNHAHGNRSADAPEAVVERNEENDYDPKLSELRSTTTNGYEGENLATRFQETQHSVGTRHVDGQLNGDCTEPGQNGRCRGAKRRKSGSVKRFNRDSYAGGEPVNTERPAGTTEQVQTGAAGNAGQNGHKRTDHARAACTIVKIIKPVRYSAAVASSMQDASVTFIALRSDGTEVLVDNTYLKAYYPILLINYYEQHLRYTPEHD